jgi:hypothetical protein
LCRPRKREERRPLTFTTQMQSAHVTPLHSTAACVSLLSPAKELNKKKKVKETTNKPAESSLNLFIFVFFKLIKKIYNS